MREICIHPFKGSFSDRWIEYCFNNKIPHRIVDCFRNDIIDQLHNCYGLLWHWSHKDARASKFARQLTFSLEKKGIKVFPSYQSAWHFDDKLGQKYLLESIDAPLIPTYIFYDKKEALKWVNETTFPKVFKLSNGAGAQNVEYVKDIVQARGLVRKAFGRGFPYVNRYSIFKDRLANYFKTKTPHDLYLLLRGGIRLAVPTHYERTLGRDRGYIYFQEFIANNDHDIRVIVIGDKAIAIKRGVRDNDFRASGSGKISYQKEEINEECIKISFEICDLLSISTLALDFIFDGTKPLIAEISYGFSFKAYDYCPGYWDRSLNWTYSKIDAPAMIIENFINEEIR